MAVKVRAVRQERGITVYELAKRSGLAQSFVWKLDQGISKAPSIDTLIKLSKALNCDIGDLYEAERA